MAEGGEGGGGEGEGGGGEGEGGGGEGEGGGGEGEGGDASSELVIATIPEDQKHLVCVEYPGKNVNWPETDRSC